MGNAMSASLAPECTPLKKEYDDCFNVWYDKFLKGESNMNECQGRFDKYQMCVQAALVKQGIIKNLEEARTEAPFETGGNTKAE